MCNYTEEALRVHAISQCGSHRENTANGYLVRRSDGDGHGHTWELNNSLIRHAGKGNVHPTTGHEGPEGVVEV